jgi:hypothetical protein
MKERREKGFATFCGDEKKPIETAKITMFWYN